MREHLRWMLRLAVTGGGGLSANQDRLRLHCVQYSGGSEKGGGSEGRGSADNMFVRSHLPPAPLQSINWGTPVVEQIAEAGGAANRFWPGGVRVRTEEEEDVRKRLCQV